MSYAALGAILALIGIVVLLFTTVDLLGWILLIAGIVVLIIGFIPRGGARRL